MDDEELQSYFKEPLPEDQVTRLRAMSNAIRVTVKNHSKMVAAATEDGRIVDPMIQHLMLTTMVMGGATLMLLDDLEKRLR